MLRERSKERLEQGGEDRGAIRLVLDDFCLFFSRGDVHHEGPCEPKDLKSSLLDLFRSLFRSLFEAF